MAQPTAEQMIARAADIHGRNVAAGWWTDLQTGESLKGKRRPLELLALVHSELSEALEGDRKNLMDDKLPHRSMFEAERFDLDLDGAIDEKLAFNAARADHKPENRKLVGGKAY